MPNVIEQRHHQLESEDAEGRDPVCRGQREQFWDEIAEEYDERKNRQRRDPGWQMGDEGTFPNENKTQYDQGHVDHRVAEQEDVEHPARIIAEGPEEIRKGGMLLLQTLNLVAFQGEKGCLQAGKKRRAVDQETDRGKKKREPDCRHPLPAAVCTTALHWKKNACLVAGHHCRNETKLSVNKGQRISRLVEQLGGPPPEQATDEIAEHPCYVGFFRCWNERRYYEAHDVLEHLWLRTKSDDANYFKGLIQAAGGFVHLQKQHARPTHPKDGRRMYPAVRLFRLAEKNLSLFVPIRHRLNVAELLALIRAQTNAITESNYRENPWSPEGAPHLQLLTGEDQFRPGNKKDERQE
jgi:hypothetical protein